MAFETLIVTDRGSIRTITINRPDVLNALNQQVLQELSGALDEVTAAKSIRAIVITGAGEKAFVAGADISAMKKMRPAEAEAFSRFGHGVMDKIETLPVPVIAAVNGFALGGGLELALACDFIYAADTAKLGLVEANLALIPGFGGIGRLSRRIGIARAREFLYCAHIATSEEALRIGLANKVFAPSAVLEEAVKTAQHMAEKGPYALEVVKRLLRTGQDSKLTVANRLEQHSFGLMFSTDDVAEGITAFLDRRKPDFVGK